MAVCTLDRRAMERACLLPGPGPGRVEGENVEGGGLPSSLLETEERSEKLDAVCFGAGVDLSVGLRFRLRLRPWHRFRFWVTVRAWVPRARNMVKGEMS